MNKKKYDERIILYLDKQMAVEEEAEFRRELSESAELRERLEQIESGLNRFKSSFKAEVEENYLINTVPRFRDKVNSRKKSSSLVPLYSGVLAAASVLVLAFIFLFDTSENEIINDFADLSQSEFELALKQYPITDNLYALTEESSDYFEQKIDSVFVDELINDKATASYFTSNDYASVISGLSEEDADYIYNEIINKDILSGDL